jgi:hypothetical protein
LQRGTIGTVIARLVPAIQAMSPRKMDHPDKPGGDVVVARRSRWASKPQ